jgi:hypothetical protein
LTCRACRASSPVRFKKSHHSVSSVDNQQISMPRSGHLRRASAHICAARCHGSCALHSTRSSHGPSHSCWPFIWVWFQVVKCSFFVSRSPSFAQYRRYGTLNLTWGRDRTTCGTARNRRCLRAVCRPSSLTCCQMTLSASPSGPEKRPCGNSHRRLRAHPRQALKNGTLARTEDRSGSR